MKSKLTSVATEILRNIAPTIGTAIGGPMGGVAAKMLSDKLLGRPDGTPSEISEALAFADPSQLAEIRRIDADFEIEMKKLGVDIEHIAMMDRDSARRREMVVKDVTPTVLAYMTMLSFFGYIGAITFFPPTDMDLGFINLAVGWLGGMASTVGAYYFGSSTGSSKKDDTINAGMKRDL